MTTSSETTSQLLATPKPTLKSSFWFGLFLCALAGMAYGCQGPLVKTAYAEGMNVTTLLTTRLCTAACGIWLITAFARPPLSYSRRTMGGFFLLGTNFVVSTATFYISLSEIAAGTSTLIVYTFPAFVIILAAIFLKDTITKSKALALIMALGGSVLTIDFSGNEKFTWLGIIFAAASSLSSAIYALLGGKFGRGLPGLAISAWSTLFSAVLYIGWCAISGQFQFNLSPLAWLCGIGVGCLTALAIGAYLFGIQIIGPSRAAISSTSEPAVAVLLSILFLGEPANPLKLLGGVLIVSAIVLLSVGRKSLTTETDTNPSSTLQSH